MVDQKVLWMVIAFGLLAQVILVWRITAQAREISSLKTLLTNAEDGAENLTNALNACWALLYGMEDPAVPATRGWDYPAQVASHLRAEFTWWHRLHTAITAPGGLTGINGALLAALQRVEPGMAARAHILEHGWVPTPPKIKTPAPLSAQDHADAVTLEEAGLSVAEVEDRCACGDFGLERCDYKITARDPRTFNNREREHTRKACSPKDVSRATIKQ